MSPDERWLVVPGWEEFQHRDAARSSVPTWIKDHTQQLSKDEYLALTWEQRGLLHDLRLEYARAKRELRADPKSLTRRLGNTVRTSQLQALVDAGFIEISSASQAHVSHTSATPRPKTRHDPDTSQTQVSQDEAPNHAVLGRFPASNPASNDASNPAGDPASLEERRRETPKGFSEQDHPQPSIESITPNLREIA